MYDSFKTWASFELIYEHDRFNSLQQFQTISQLLQDPNRSGVSSGMEEDTLNLDEAEVRSNKRRKRLKEALSFTCCKNGKQPLDFCNQYYKPFLKEI